MKVTVQQVREALAVCEGNVARTATVLGVARNNLYKRLATLGLDPDAYRRRKGDTAHAAQVAPAAHAPHAQAPPPSSGASKPASVSRSATYQAPSGAHTFPRVVLATAEPVAEAGAAEGGGKRLRISRSLYLRPDQIKKLDDACLDLPTVLREKLSASRVLELFIDDSFDQWLRGKLGQHEQHHEPASNNGKGRKRSKGGE